MGNSSIETVVYHDGDPIGEMHIQSCGKTVNRVLLTALSFIGATLLACGTASAGLVPEPSGEKSAPALEAPTIVQTETASNDVSQSHPGSPALDAIGNDVGLTAPDFALPGSGDGLYSLSSLREDRNVVLVFYRAFW